MRNDLDPEAPPVPPGMRPRSGVHVGCGRADCADCYMPNMPHTIVRELSQQSAIVTVLQRALRSGIAEDDDITSDCASIAHHLRTAAERYEDHARTLRAQSVTDEHADGVHRLAFSFETQAEQCRTLATALDEL